MSDDRTGGNSLIIHQTSIQSTSLTVIQPIQIVEREVPVLVPVDIHHHHIAVVPVPVPGPTQIQVVREPYPHYIHDQGMDRRDFAKLAGTALGVGALAGVVGYEIGTHNQPPVQQPTPAAPVEAGFIRRERVVAIDQPAQNGAYIFGNGDGRPLTAEIDPAKGGYMQLLDSAGDITIRRKPGTQGAGTKEHPTIVSLHQGMMEWYTPSTPKVNQDGTMRIDFVPNRFGTQRGVKPVSLTYPADLVTEFHVFDDKGNRLVEEHRRGDQPLQFSARFLMKGLQTNYRRSPSKLPTREQNPDLRGQMVGYVAVTGEKAWLTDVLNARGAAI